MRKSKKNSNSLKILLIVFASLLVVFLIAIYFSKYPVGLDNQSHKSNNPKLSNTKVYKSENLKIIISVPAKFQIDDRFFRITLTSLEGNIYIEKSGTNFENVDEYLDNLDVENSSVTLSRERISINNMPAIRGIVNGKRYYYIYTEKWTIFTIFADSSALFDDLDQIAPSFIYIP